MADFEVAAKNIEMKFQEEWVDTWIKWDGVGVEEPPENVPYVAFFIQEGDSFLSGMPKLIRNLGVIIVQVFVPRGLGTREGRRLADKIAAIFDCKKFLGVTTRAALVRRVVEPYNSKETQFNVTVPFFHHSQ